MTDINIQTLGYFMFRTFSNMIKLLNYELSESGLDIQYPQFAIMMVLSKNEGLSQAEMTEIIERDKSAVSRNISYLEEKGYVKRISEGRKKKLLFLTDKGKEIIPSLYRIASKNKETVLKGFSAKEKKYIQESLNKMFLNIISVIEK